jgi:alpha-1,2-mannosyltransferase
MNSDDVRFGPYRLRRETIRLILCLLPVWVLSAGELAQFAWKNAVPGPFERSGLVKGRDFVQFYVAGSLARQERWAQIYDASALKQAVDETVPAAAGVIPAPVYPPHVAVFFGPWSMAPYLSARWLWFVASVVTYAAGIAVAIRQARLSLVHRTLAWVTAFLNPALVMVLTTGQLSSVAMFAWAGAAYALTTCRPLMCGFCLGILAYKPSLLFGVGVVLLATRAWTLLGGLVLCGAAQVGTVMIVSGIRPWDEYIRSMIALPRFYYLTDTLPHQKQSFLGFFQLVVGSGPLAMCLAIGSGIGLLVLWHGHRKQTAAIWFIPMLAVTSVLLSPHFYVYDLVILTPALIVVAGALARTTVAGSTERVLAWSSYALLLAPYSGVLASQWRVQWSTLAIFTFLLAVHRIWLADSASQVA